MTILKEVTFTNGTALTMGFKGSDVYLTVDKTKPIPVGELLPLMQLIRKEQRPVKMPRSVMRGVRSRGPRRFE